MAIREGLLLRRMPGMNLVMPKGTYAKEFRKTVMLNDTAAFLFELFQNGETEESAVKKLIEVYAIDAETAENAVRKTVQSFAEAGLWID